MKLKDLFWISSADDAQEASSDVRVPASEAPVQSARGVAGSIERILSGLGDVDGVVGGLAIAPDGTILGKSPPDLFDVETLDRVSARIAQLLAALSSDANGANAPRGGVLRFRDRQLYLNPIASGVIGVLAENRVNVPALTMALRIVAQQLDGRSSHAPAAGRS